MLTLGLSVVLLSVTLAPPSEEAVEAAQKLLKEKNLYKTGNRYALRDERGLKKLFEEVDKLQRQLKARSQKTKAKTRESNQAQPLDDDAAIDRRIEEIRREQAELDGQYQQARSTSERNRIMTQRNTLTMELQRLIASRNQPPSTSKPADATDQRIAEIRSRLDELEAQHAQAHSAKERNRIIEEQNKLSMELDRLAQGRRVRTGAGNSLAGEKAADPADKIRQDLIGKVLDLRRTMDSMKSQYTALGADAAVTDAIETLNQKDGEDRRLGPRASFARYEKKLKKLEDSIRSESIPMRRQGGVGLADVVINGQHTVAMVVDTGASWVTLSSKQAASIGLRPGPQTPRVAATLASGEVVEGCYRMTLSSVRVGSFERHDVPCAVMPQADAPALLGGSFLSQFHVVYDAANGRLTLSEIRSDSARTPKP